MAKEEKRMPEASFRVGKLMKASVWKNVGKADNGREYVFLNVQLQKSWTEDDGKTFQNKDISLSIDEIPKAVAALHAAYNYALVSKE